MSGVKCNKNVKTVRRINPASADVLFDQMQSKVERTNRKIEQLKSRQKQDKPVLSSFSLKSELNVLNLNKIKTKSVDTAKTEAISAVQRIMSKAYTESANSVKSIQSKLELINHSQSTNEIANVYNEIAAEIVQENSKVFNASVVDIVKTAMIENGFDSIKHKTIGTTPVLICRNSKGQTIRNEIASGIDGKTSINRIQFGILESECDELNERINASLIKHGLEYESFEVIEHAKETGTQRTLSFSSVETENNINNEQNINQNGKR